MSAKKISVMWCAGKSKAVFESHCLFQYLQKNQGRIISMLESQKKFAIYLKKIQALLEGQPFSFDQSLLHKVMETELVVPVIGAFSAGKSSLLNELIGMEVAKMSA